MSGTPETPPLEPKATPEAAGLLDAKKKSQRGFARRGFGTLVGLGALTTWLWGQFGESVQNSGLSFIPGTQGSFRIYNVAPLPDVSLEDWTMPIVGNVENPHTFTHAEIRDIGIEQVVQDFHCVTGWSVFNVTWTGIPLVTLLDIAGAPHTGNVTFESLDGAYWESLTMEQARDPENFVAFEIDDKPLPRQQGYPARLLVPAMYGYKGTKFIGRIVVEDELTGGYWVARGYDQHGWVGRSNGRA